jgi:hypothetical protein
LTRIWRVACFAFCTASCDRLLHRGGVADAGVTSTAVVASEDDEESVIAPVDAGSCPVSIHPAYCRGRCRGYAERARAMHARRVSNPLRSGVGGCGSYKVFAEEARGADGGATGGIVEYFDGTTNELVGAEDSRGSGCHTYGVIPKCTLEIKWNLPRP